MKIILVLVVVTKLVLAEVFICEGENTLAKVEIIGKYQIKTNINGQKFEGEWKGSTVDETGESVKLYYLYTNNNIWIHVQRNSKRHQ